MILSLYYSLASQESVGGAIHRATVNQLPRSVFGDAEILLSGEIFLVF